MAITSISQLKLLLQSRIKKALDITCDEIYYVFRKHLEEYYDEYDPNYYQRTYSFLNSLIKTEVVQKGNSLSCQIKIDEDYLKYQYEGNFGWSENVPATGRDVATWANEGLHGGTIQGKSKWWDDAMNELGGKQGILNIMKKNLKAVGIPLSK